MKHDTHTQHIMRDTDSFYVRICSCGVVHLCFGPTTLNLTPHAMIAVTETLKQVSEEVKIRVQANSEISKQAPPANIAQIIQLKV